jgi:molybdopterin-guanine dinucleotide biosynthesis protein A
MTSVAILIGGRATRYGGADKSALVVDGHTILSRQLEAARGMTDDILLVGRVAPAVIPPQTRFVADRVVDAGPLGGLDAALAAARERSVLLLACDMPFVSVELLDALAVLASTVDVVVPKTEHGYHPLCAVYANTCHPAVERRLAAGHLKMVDLLNDLRVRAIAASELDALGPHQQLLANVNTPAEFEKLAALSGHKP